MKILPQHIQQLAEQYRGDLVQTRRHLHQHPELSFEEAETAAYVARYLSAWGIPFQAGVAGHGIVALIEGRNPAKGFIALRGDMDALPIHEANDVPYRSQRDGVMHACGHDVHTTCLLGAARLLNELRDRWEGAVKLLFQPAEERLPGGASLMIKAGALEQPAPAAIFGQHVFPLLEAGKVGFRAGMYMASSDELYMTVKGKGGHGAMPHECVDPIIISAHILTALQQVVSRYADPTKPSVLTFGHIASSGGTTNVIPDEVKLMGTFRAMDEKWRFEAHNRMQQLARGIAESMGGHCELRIEVGYPTLFNDEKLTDKARQNAVAYLGAENVVDLPIRLTSEDFAYFSQVIPGCFYRLGTRNAERGITSLLHTNTFDIDEDSLPIGAGLLAWLAVCELNV